MIGGEQEQNFWGAGYILFLELGPGHTGFVKFNELLFTILH